MGMRGSRPVAGRVRFGAHRAIIPAMFCLLCVCSVTLLYSTDNKATRPVRLDSRYMPSNHLHAYISRTFLALTPRVDDPLRAKVDQYFKLAKDQIETVNTYASFARKAKLDTSRQLRLFEETSANYTDFLEKAEYRALLDDAIVDKEVLNQFDKELREYMTETKKITMDAREVYDNQVRVQKLKDTLFAINDQLTRAKKQGAFSSLIAAKSIPKSLHCISMRLMQERAAHPERYVRDLSVPELEDPNLYHYAIFSDNVIAASVVVNSAIRNVKEAKQHVFHVVTDNMNLGAMTVWFKKRPPQGAHIDVKAVEDFKFLNTSYVPVLRQLESAKLQRFYFENEMENSTKDTANMKFRNPKYLSMLNHLRFYLPEMYPKLHRILFLDDDVVVQKDLTGLWEVDMDGNVNGAVETCFGSFHRYDKYLNFSHPLIKAKFDPKACGWAYGMNLFDLDAWRREKSTEEYHYWQNLDNRIPAFTQLKIPDGCFGTVQNENRALWKLGTLPPGLIAFYNTTKPLDKTWHVLGLGYNPSIPIVQIKAAAVIHYNGNMKPWLDLAFNQYREFWTKYVDYDMEYVQMCNFGH